MRPFLFSILLAAACGGPTGTGETVEPPVTVTAPTPLTDAPTFRYQGLLSGLYPDGGNEPPAAHAADGRAALALIRPLDAQGNPDPDGRIVLVSAGMSNTTQEFCSTNAERPCNARSFMGQAAADPAVDREHLVIVNGAYSGQVVESWDEPDDDNYDRVRDTWLADLGVTERQIQVAWVKEANPRPSVSLPSANADAYAIEAGLGRIVRAMKTRWPNLRMVFFSSRTYGGYAVTLLNPEPYAFESAFGVRGVIAAQIEQERSGAIDAQAGDVGLDGAPWLAWGPYLWADGANPRDDGLAWLRSDFDLDGTHPSPSGEEKVGRLLLDFFRSSPFSQCWFLAGRTCQN